MKKTMVIMIIMIQRIIRTKAFITTVMTIITI